jgi:hypothetical protein
VVFVVASARLPRAVVIVVILFPWSTAGKVVIVVSTAMRAVVVILVPVAGHTVSWEGVTSRDP